MSKLKLDFEVIGMGIVAAVISTAIFMPKGGTPETQITKAQEPEVTLEAIPTSTPTAIPTTVPEFSSVDSSDGTRTLTMKKQTSAGSTTYSFMTIDRSNNVSKMLFTTVADATQTLFLPDNSWSTNNSYVFIEKDTGSEKNYLVFLSSGSNFPDGSQFINVRDFFSQELPRYTLDEVTGWGGGGLLILNTKTSEGSVGPSFWFNVANQRFIQLASHYG